jgi:hypothetical protein
MTACKPRVGQWLLSEAQYGDQLPLGRARRGLGDPLSATKNAAVTSAAHPKRRSDATIVAAKVKWFNLGVSPEGARPPVIYRKNEIGKGKAAR